MLHQNELVISIAIVSDMHAYASTMNSQNSFLDYTGDVGVAGNPLTDLIKEVERRQVKADTLVCAGDICNRADYGGLRNAWRDLHNLGTTFGGGQVIATCGNHDLDSRFLTNEVDPDPKGALQSLLPKFPFSDIALSNQFWAQNYAIVPHESGAVFVVLNTSAYHGGKQDEISHGRISRRTIESLSLALEETKDAKAHILICHHHPIPLKSVSPNPDLEYIRNGQELLDAITKATGNSWLIIHGHRHYPRLICGASGTNSYPFVLGAGSLGAQMPGVPNQFHIVQVFKSNLTDHSSLIGTVESWSWTQSTGWTAASHSSGLPGKCGFGYTGQIKGLANLISKKIKKTFLSWENIRNLVPAVDYLMPDAFSELESELEKLKISILRDTFGHPNQVGK